MENTDDRHYFYEHAEWIDEHLSNLYSDDEVTVFHEIYSPDIHLDVYYIRSDKHNFNILLTAGMSTLAMNVPEDIDGYEDLQFAELMALVPKDIDFADVHTGENPNDWIISMLKLTARFPHEYDTWIGEGHTLQYSADFEPYSDETEFAGAVLLPSATLDEDFTEIRRDGKLITIHSVFPLYRDEVEFKIENGYGRFFDLLIENDTKEVVDNGRESLV